MTAPANMGLRVISFSKPPALDMAPDIYAADRALCRSIDWAAVHIAADRSAPVDIADVRRVRRA